MDDQNPKPQANEDVLMKLALQLTGSVLDLESSVKAVIQKHIKDTVMLSLGFEKDCGSYRVHSAKGTVIVDIMRKIAREVIAKQGVGIFKKIIEAKPDKDKFVKTIRDDFRYQYEMALIEELERLFEEKIKLATDDFKKQITNEMPKNLAIVMNPVMDAVQKDVLQKLADGEICEWSNDVQTIIHKVRVVKGQL